MFKATPLYGYPVDENAFEKYYAATHTPTVLKMKGVSKFEFIKFLSAPDGVKTASYHMVELNFPGTVVIMAGTIPD